MTVLDAYAVLAYLRDEHAAQSVADLLRSPTVLTAVNVGEVVDQLVRVYAQDADDVHADLAVLSHSGMQLLPLSPDLGILAGRLRARHYHRQRMPVSLADCVAAGTALVTGRPLATADPALAKLVLAEGGSLHGLPDSAGRWPLDHA